MDPKEYLDRQFESGAPRHCWMCGCALSRGSASVDHLNPRSRKGRDDKSNYRLACKPCNGARGNRPLTAEEWAKATGRTQGTKRDFSVLAAAIQAQRSLERDSRIVKKGR